MGDRRARARAATSGAARRTELRTRTGPARSAATIDPRQAAVHATAPELMDLQRSAGNAAVLELVQRALDMQRKPPKKTTAAPWHQSKRPVLRLGDGPMSSVAELQQALNAVVPGQPLRITGMFDADTQAKVKAYQKAEGFPFVTGVATKQTWWNLDKDAPRVVRQGSRVVLGPEKGEARGRLETGTTHPTLKIGSKGPAVEELQQKLNTVPANQVTIYLSTHGKFDKTTRIGVLDFQKSRKPPLKANGIVGKDTWAALDAVAGPVKVGRESFAWDQRSEGTVTGTDARFTWRLLPDRLQVTVNIRFTGHSKHPMVAQWLGDITRNWNAFKFVDGSKPPKARLLDFVVGSGSPADATVKITKTPKNAKEIPRSDAGEWHTGDTHPGLAPHEFGHLIGLQDEYNKGPEQYTIVTGEQPPIGNVQAPTNAKGDPVEPEVIAAEMRKAVGGKASTRGRRARAVVEKYGLRQGAFAQRIALAYEKANAGKLLREEFNSTKGFFLAKAPGGSMGDDLAARIPGRFDKAGNEAVAVEPFFYTNRGIMGDMDEVANPSGIDPHDHPVAERHVRHFLQIVQGNLPGSWKTVRR